MTRSWGGRSLAGTAAHAAVTLGIAVCIGGATVSQAWAEPTRKHALSAEYDVYVGGFHVVTSGMQVSLEEQHYEIRLDAVTAGVPGWFTDWWAVVESEGEIAGERLDAGNHTVERFRRGDLAKTALDFRDNGDVLVTYDPVRNDLAGPLPRAMIRDTVDPLSGLVAVVAAVSQKSGCDMTVPVYDGRRRYDLAFTDLGMQQLRPSRRSSYTGVARRCRMQMEPVAGAFNDDDESVWSNDADPRRRRLDIWLAEPVAGGISVPVRMLGYSSLGAVVVHLQRAEVLAGRTDAAESR